MAIIGSIAASNSSFTDFPKDRLAGVVWGWVGLVKRGYSSLESSGSSGLGMDIGVGIVIGEGIPMGMLGSEDTGRPMVSWSWMKPGGLWGTSRAGGLS